MQSLQLGGFSDSSAAEGLRSCNLSQAAHALLCRPGWPTPAHLEHGPRMLGVAGAVPEVAGAQAARHQLPRPLKQPPPLDVHPVLLVPYRSSPACRVTSVLGGCYVDL